MKRIPMFFVFILGLALMSACTSNETNSQVNADWSNTPQTTHNEKSSSNHSTATPNSNNASDEQTGNSDTLVMLQEALNFIRAVDRLNYNTNSSSIYNYLSYDDPSVRIVDGYYGTEDGTMNRNPSQAHIRGHTLSITTEEHEHVSDTVDERHSFFDYYLSKDLGLYYHYDDVGNWFREDLSDEFRTIEHIEEMLQFFMSYPEQLSVSESEPLDEEEIFEGYEIVN